MWFKLTTPENKHYLNKSYDRNQDLLVFRTCLSQGLENVFLGCVIEQNKVTEVFYLREYSSKRRHTSNIKSFKDYWCCHKTITFFFYFLYHFTTEAWKKTYLMLTTQRHSHQMFKALKPQFCYLCCLKQKQMSTKALCGGLSLSDTKNLISI